MRYIYIISFFFYAFLSELNAQCNFNDNIVIEDNSSISLDIVVSGAANNDLSTNNCLKAVLINFDHDFLSDLTIEVEAPNGQKVKLIGAEAIGGNTGLVTGWEIKFFNETELTAIPDPDHEEKWNSIATWIGFTTFTGSYYPYEGSLDDFTGSVNGNWKINISDNAIGGVGNFSCAGLVFCDTDGIEINSCSPVASDIQNSDIYACEGAEELNIDIDLNLDAAYDSTYYSYDYLLFNEASYVSTIATTDLSDYDYGTYTICGLHYFTDDGNFISEIPVGSTKDEIGDYLTSNVVCSKLSDDCMKVTINRVPEFIVEDRTICQGESVVINGETYTSTGVYDITTPQSPCDSLSQLNLTVINASISISKSMDSLSCQNDTLTLDASASTLPNGASIIWRTSAGEIVSNTTGQSVKITKAGTYIFEIDANGCVFEDSISIAATKDFSFTFIEPALLSCSVDQDTIDLITMDSIIMINWTGPGIVSMLNEDAIINQGGDYKVTFKTKEDCDIERTVSVTDDRVYPLYSFAGDTISCNQPEVVIQSVIADENNSTYNWVFNNQDVGVDSYYKADTVGDYTLYMTTQEGCVDSFFFNIPSIVQDVQATLVSSDLGCGDSETGVAYESLIGGLNVLWTLPDNSTLIDSSFTTNIAGNYTLELTDDNGCRLDTMLTIERDEQVPVIMADDAVFNCGDDSIQLSAVVDIVDVTYLWTNTVGYSSSEQNPYIYTPGEYFLEVCRPNGCCAYDTLMASTDQSLPNISFETSNLDCSKDTVYIVPSDPTSYDMNWFENGTQLVVSTLSLEVTKSGNYSVEVIDRNNGCKSKYDFFISKDTISTLDSIYSKSLNCENTSVVINVDSPTSFNAFTWDGPGLLSADLQPLVNQKGNYTINYELSNGCSGKDSIEIVQEGEIPNLTVVEDTISCSAPEATLTATYESSTISISWSGPEGFSQTGDQINTIIPGMYNVYAVAPGACRDTVVVQVFADTLSPQISIVNDGIITCADSTVSIDLTIDNLTSSYLFDGPGIVKENATNIVVDKGGTYSAIASADNGCETMVSTIVNQKTDYPEYMAVLDSITCVKSMVTVGISSPNNMLDVKWNGPSVVADDLYTFTTDESGIYTFELTNNYGCTVFDSLLVVRDTFLPENKILLSNLLSCDFSDANFSIQNLNPSWQIEWSGPDVTDPNVEGFLTSTVGTYNLQLTGENGCVSSSSAELTYDTIAANIDVLGDNITCLVGKVFLSVETNLDLRSYTWAGPNGYMSSDAKPLIFEEGRYMVSVLAENGCMSSDFIDIVDERAFPTVSVSDYYLPCDGAPALVTYDELSEGAQVRWIGDNFSGSADTVEIFNEGEYVVIAISPEGCDLRDTFSVIDEPVFPNFSAEGNTLLCKGAVPITAIDIEDDRSVQWTGPQGFLSFNPIAFAEEPGVYKLSVTGTNGCVDTASVLVVDGRVDPNVMANLFEPFQCNNLTVHLSAQGSSVGSEFTYNWTTQDGIIVENPNTFSPLVEGEGSYSLKVENVETGCFSTDTIVLKLDAQSLSELLLSTTPPSCPEYENGIISIDGFIGGYAPFLITVDSFDYGENNTIKYLSGEQHLIHVEDSLGCTLDTIVTIPPNPILMVDLPADTLMFLGQSIFVDGGINLPADSIASINWSSNVPCDGCSEFEISPQGNMTITLEVTDINGCVVMDEFRIKLNRPDNVPFPQIFSPNGDGKNDIFYLPMTLGIDKIDYMRIYDSWGGLLFEKGEHLSGDESLGWDGTVNGQRVEQGVYIVEAVATLSDGTKVTYVSDLTVIR